MLFLLLSNAVAGGVWRRVLGGWLNLRRSYIVAAGVLLSWPLYLVFPWYWALLGTGLLALFWTNGHRFDKWTIVLRYPIVGGIYLIGKKYWPERYTEVAEVVIGTAVYLAIGVLAL